LTRSARVCCRSRPPVGKSGLAIDWFVYLYVCLLRYIV
jgi:hypothetical protein